MRKKIVAIIQARCGSTRLPNKVLLDIVPNVSILEMLITRLNCCVEIGTMFIATTKLVDDDPIATLAQKLNIGIFRGDSKNVQSRYVEVAKSENADVIVRITADCPFLDPHLVDYAITTYLSADSDIYVSSALNPRYPAGQHVEVFSADILLDAASQSSHPECLEHVTPFIYNNPHLYPIKSLDAQFDGSWARLTVDYPDDLEFARILASRINWRTAGIADILKYLSDNSELLGINARFLVNQKLLRYLP